MGTDPEFITVRPSIEGKMKNKEDSSSSYEHNMRFQCTFLF